MANFFRGPSSLVTFKVLQEFVHGIKKIDPRFLIEAHSRVIKCGDLIFDDITIFDETGNACFRYIISLPSWPITFAKCSTSSKTGDQIRDLLLDCLWRNSNEH